MIKKNPRKTIYLIEWQDAHSASKWHTDDEVKEFIEEDMCICLESGWILSETKDEIVIACRMLKWKKDSDPEWGMLQKIPKAWIRKKVIWKLKEDI